jgi:hypothetical protein
LTPGTRATVGELGGPIDARVFTSARPTRAKVSLHVERVDASKVEVRLSLPLDIVNVDELAAYPLVQDDRLYVRYLVELDLRAERAALADQLAAMYRTDEGRRLATSATLTQAELRRILAPLAHQGWSILDRLVFSATPCGYPDHVDVVRRAVQSALRRPQIIDVASSEPLFPWALLFDGRDFNPTDFSTLDPERFWGFHHEIQERTEGTSPLWRLPEQPRIVKSVCSQVDTQGWHAIATHPLARYGNTFPSPTTTELGQTLSNFDGDCLYFFGHAGHDSDPPVPATSWIKLRGVQLTVAALQSYYRAPRFHSELVVVFLNGCRTSPLGAWNDGSLLGYLCKHGHGRVCCLATVAEVPEDFAAQLARHFWEAFVFARLPIGEALLEARRTMLRQPPHSPLGLVYTLFGRVDTRIPEQPHG